MRHARRDQVLGRECLDLLSACRFPCKPVFVRETVLEDREVLLSWEFSGLPTIGAKLLGACLERSPEGNSPEPAPRNPARDSENLPLICAPVKDFLGLGIVTKHCVLLAAHFSAASCGTNGGLPTPPRFQGEHF